MAKRKDGKPPKPRTQHLPGRRTSQYTDEQVIEVKALYQIYGSCRRVAEMVGIPEGTVYDWISAEWREDRTDPATKIRDYEQRLQAAHKRLVANSLYLMSKAQQQISDKLPEASAAQAATIYGILADKVRYATQDTGLFSGSGSASLHINLGSMSSDDQAALISRVLERHQAAQAPPADDQQVIDVEPDTDADSTDTVDGQQSEEHPEGI